MGGALRAGLAPPAPMFMALGPIRGGAMGVSAPEKYWFARRWMSTVSADARSASDGACAGRTSASGRSLVLMVLADLDVLEHAERVVGQHRRRAVERNQVRRGAALVDAHETHREARAGFAGDAGLEEADHAALLLAGAKEQDVRGPLRA